MVLLAIVLTLFCLVGWIIAAFRPGRPRWVAIGVAPGVVSLAFYFFAVCRHITPSFDPVPNLGVNEYFLVWMVGGFIALLSEPKRKPPAKPPGDQHDGAAHA